MGNEAGAIDFEDKDVVDNADLLGVYELHLTLMAVGVDGEADTVSGINVAGLGEETDEERDTLDFSGGLRMDVASYTNVGAWVEPLPLFSVGAEVGVGLSREHWEVGGGR